METLSRRDGGSYGGRQGRRAGARYRTGALVMPAGRTQSRTGSKSHRGSEANVDG